MLMERKYYREFNPMDKNIPAPARLPTAEKEPPPKPIEKGLGGAFRADDFILLGLIAVLLMEEQKDFLTIGLLAMIFLSEYM